MADPVITEVTDSFRALLQQLRACPALTQLTSTRIAAEPQDDWTKGAPAVFVRQVGGGAMPDVRHQYPRFDIWCLGATGVQANQVWRRVHAWLLPTPSDRPVSFKQGNTVVYSVVQDGGQSRRYPTKEEPWHAIVQAYVLDVSEVPL